MMPITGVIHDPAELLQKRLQRILPCALNCPRLPCGPPLLAELAQSSPERDGVAASHKLKVQAVDPATLRIVG